MGEAIQQFESGDFRVLLVPTGGLWRENCYLVEHRSARELLIIDPGDAPELILEVARQSGSLVAGVLLTHAHHDHLAGAAVVCEAFSQPLRLHVGDLRLLRHAPMYSMRFGGRLFTLPERIETFETAPAMLLGGAPVETLLTPGHTAGGVCYRFGDFVMTGDTILYGHVGRTDMPGGNSELLADSVSRLLEKLPAGMLLLGGHRQPWTVEEARAWWTASRLAPLAYTE